MAVWCTSVYVRVCTMYHYTISNSHDANLDGLEFRGC